MGSEERSLVKLNEVNKGGNIRRRRGKCMGRGEFEEERKKWGMKGGMGKLRE